MRDLIVWGLGELGQFFASAALRTGMRVTPITRGMRAGDVLSTLAEDTPILVAVGETDLEPVLDALPPTRASSLILLQNELFPPLWERRGLTPSVLIPWFLKKRGQPLLVARSTPVYGQHAPLIDGWHGAHGLQTERLHDDAALAQALVDKYTFILCINALGLLRDCSLGEWLTSDPEQVRALALEFAALGAGLCGRNVDASAARLATEQGMADLGSMKARGRSAQERVRRALRNAEQLGLELPSLRALAGKLAG